MKRRIVALLLCAMLATQAITVCAYEDGEASEDVSMSVALGESVEDAGAAEADMVYEEGKLSGITAEAHSQTEIIEYARSHGISTSDLQDYRDTYQAQPVTSAPYAPGKLSDASQAKAIAWLNFFRYVGGVDPTVVAKDSYIEAAQAASLVNSVNRSLSHKPSRPAGMDDALYELGKKGASSSNIAVGYGSTVGTLIGYMAEGSGNLSTMGHRRWVLDPAMEASGFGYVGSYSAMYAFGYEDYSKRNGKVIAWPAQNTPIELLGYELDDVYFTISTGINLDASQVTVTMRRNDGKTWQLSSANGNLSVNNGGYGQKGCIIMNPGIEVKDVKSGDTYSLSVHTEAGDFSYQVNMFSMNSSTPKDMPFIDVPAGAYFYEPVKWAFKNNITTGISSTLFGPDNSCTRGQMVTFLWRAAGSPEPRSSTNPFVDVKPSAYYYKPVLWALENGITTGTSSTTFSPNADVSRAQTVTFIWRAAGKPSASAPGRFEDVPANVYYTEAVGWAVENNITTGTSSTTFSPNNNCTRGQIVTFLYRKYAQ